MTLLSFSRLRQFLLILALLLVARDGLTATTWYVATNGLDTNDGSSNTPFATIMRAQAAASSGDTVYLRGGTYYLNSSHLTATNSPWAIVNNITNNGISYIAFPGERPVFDFSAVAPYGFRTTAFQILSNNCVFEGFDVVGVPIVITNAGTQSECFRVDGGNNNRFELLRMHDGHGIGFYLTDGASNLVLNCDAYNNQGINANSVGNIDGFGIHAGHSTGVSNVIRGCRAWFNSDDGYDLINNKGGKVLIDHCWSFYNGYSNTLFVPTGGNANGFKSGGFGVSGGSYPIPPPRNRVQFCLAVRNGGNGFYANFHPDGLDFINNTSMKNAPNGGKTGDYNMVCILTNTSISLQIQGTNHFMRNNIALERTDTNTVINLNTNWCDVAYNFFDLPVTVSSNDFMSLDESLLTLPRQTNGDLPYIAFARLVSSSDLVDAGTNVGFAYVGAAPDLGAFEYGDQLPTLTIVSSGANVILNGGNGPAGGTNYLVGSSDLALPPSQWPRVATNKFDLTGNFTLTNSTAGNPQLFYRVALP
jgi:pectate lyase